ncbi:uncharacterized protein [Amphiura filiformis]|uniref:uncharacterized protein n=1 Tax=Amphiura filiformis TaxID=82378 RepID=UPI003B20DE06
MDILAPSVHLEGFLQLRSAGPVKSMKKKWFVLRDQEFKVYNNPNDAISRNACQDMIYIHDIQGVRKLASGSSSKCGIEIVSRFRKYTLVAANTRDQDKWVKAFHDAMRNVHMRSLSSPIPVAYNVDREDQQHHQRPHSPSTPPEVRKYRVSAAECMGTSSSQKKRLFSDSWIGKKLTRKSASVDDELLDPNRNSRHSSSGQSVVSDDRDHIYDVVTEFKTITEDINQMVSEDNQVVSSEDNQMVMEQNNGSDDDVFENDAQQENGVQPENGVQRENGVQLENGVQQENVQRENGVQRENVVQQENCVQKEERLELAGDELYDSVPRDNESTIEVVVKDTTKENNNAEMNITSSQKVESVEVDESTAEAFEDPTYIEELRVDDGVEELRKMIRDSGLDFDDVEDDYERIEGVGDDDETPAMAKLREMLGTM